VVEGKCFWHSKDGFGVRYRFQFGCSGFGLFDQGDSSSGDTHRFIVPPRVDETSKVGNIKSTEVEVIRAGQTFVHTRDSRGNFFFHEVCTVDSKVVVNGESCCFRKGIKVCKGRQVSL